MAGELLLDTSILVDILAGSREAQGVVSGSTRAYVPSIALGELFFGAERANRRAAELARIERFAITNEVLPCDLVTARFYGEIRHALRRKGRPIPANDIWIAALAQQHDLTLATRDAHFRDVDALSLLSW
ncbi:MAG TPA: type II toxin-antitoxin system VapC family toxin [Longimicrobium sp.]|jgi:tRNA(fMet)-specific endonuclease VapC